MPRRALAATAAGIALLIAVLASLLWRPVDQPAAPSAARTAGVAPTASLLPTAIAAPTGTVFGAATAPAAASGTITGLLGYPSDFLPAMKVFAVGTADVAGWYRVDTEQSRTQISYTLDHVPAGTYRVYAYAQSSAPASFFAGSYTEYVRCGLQPPCADHTAIVITVREGATTRGVDLLDWYAPPGSFPPPPQ